MERVFRTWEETIFAHYWLVPSLVSTITQTRVNPVKIAA